MTGLLHHASLGRGDPGAGAKSKSSIKTRPGAADRRTGRGGDDSFGAALHYFTGSKEHNVAIRALGVKKGIKINEYGGVRRARRGGAGRRSGGVTEEEIFASGRSSLDPSRAAGKRRRDPGRRRRAPAQAHRASPTCAAIYYAHRTGDRWQKRDSGRDGPGRARAGARSTSRSPIIRRT